MSLNLPRNSVSGENGKIKSSKLSAKKRWNILRAVLKIRAPESGKPSDVSVRRFQSFGLFQTITLKANQTEEDNCISWFQFQSDKHADFDVNIRQCTVIDLNTLSGFNNTGNICIWPSEEILTFYCLEHRDQFRNKVVVELGGGMTCLAGIAIAVCTKAAKVIMSDGNEKSMQNVSSVLLANDDKFLGKEVFSRVIKWGNEQDYEDLIGMVDCVIAADCFFFADGREKLANTIDALLKPGGEALMFAPLRKDTFDSYAEICRQKPAFECDKVKNYHSTVWDLHCEYLQSQPNLYDPDIHYPWMLKINKRA